VYRSPLCKEHLMFRVDKIGSVVSRLLTICMYRNYDGMHRLITNLLLSNSTVIKSELV
jgi:hypothetical protein